MATAEKPGDGPADTTPRKESGVVKVIENPSQEILWNLIDLLPAITTKDFYFRMRAKGIDPAGLIGLMARGSTQDVNKALNSLPDNVVPLTTLKYGVGSQTGQLTPQGISLDSSPSCATIENLVFLQIRLDDVLNRGNVNRYHEIIVEDVRNAASLGHFHVPSFEIYDIDQFYLSFQGSGKQRPFTELMYIGGPTQPVLHLRGTTSFNEDPEAKLSDVLMQSAISNTNHVLARRIDEYNGSQAHV